MNNFLRGVLIFLLLVTAFFLLGLLFWLYHCHCCGRQKPHQGELTSAPPNSATAEPQHPRGKYPPYQIPTDTVPNEDHPRIVPTGPHRRTLAPADQRSALD